MWFFRYNPKKENAKKIIRKKPDTWFKPLFSMVVATNVAKEFLKLVIFSIQYSTVAMIYKLSRPSSEKSTPIMLMLTVMLPELSEKEQLVKTLEPSWWR